MKLGIVTLTGNNNYGNRLQNYAVTQILRREFRCPVETIWPQETGKTYNTYWLKEKIMLCLCRIFPNWSEQKWGSITTRWANFISWNKNIPIRKLYKTKSIPSDLNAEYSHFIVGSDQVWNYNFAAKWFSDMFLCFADDSKKIALSASFGVDTVTADWKDKIAAELLRFSSISVREQAGQKIVKELTGRDVPVLIDPVMMLSPEDWTKVSKTPRVDCSKPYILKYCLGKKTQESSSVRQWAEENGLEIYELLNKDIPRLYSAGPGEFISLIKNASFVYSDSFHCIVFSMLFHKPFMVLERREINIDKAKDMSSRLNTLLHLFNFENRKSNLLAPEDYLSCDYSAFQETLHREQEKFRDYLKNAIQ